MNEWIKNNLTDVDIDMIFLINWNLFTQFGSNEYRLKDLRKELISEPTYTLYFILEIGWDLDPERLLFMLLFIYLHC